MHYLFCHSSKKQLFTIVVFIMMHVLLLQKTTAQNLFFEKVTGQEISPITAIHGIAKDSVGYIWFGSWNGVYRYDGKTFDLYYYKPNDSTSIPNNRIRNIISDKNDGLWFLTFDRKYVKFNYQLNNFTTVEDAFVPNIIKTQLSYGNNKINRDKVVNGKVYYLSSHLFTSKEIKSGKEHQYLADIRQSGSLLDDYISSFYIDDENIIWLGARNGDIYKANPHRNPFNLHYTYRPNTEKSKLITVRTILKVKNKTWLGTDEGILIYDKEGNLDLNNPFYQAKSQTKFVRTLFKDQQDGIWIGGVNGLEYYNKTSNKIEPIFNRALYPDKEKPFSVYAMVSIEKNALWIGLYDGIARVDLKSKEILFYDFEKEIRNHSVTDILFLDQQHLLLATEGNGIIPVKLNEKQKAFVDEELQSKGINVSVPAKIIYTLYKDKKGFLWAGTSDGLYKLNLKDKSIKTEEIKLQYETKGTYISSITDDELGNIWIAHKDGISMIDILTDKVVNYQKEDQFGSWSFWERAMYKDTLGQQIYFGAKNGYVSFQPNKIKAVVDSNNKIILKKLFVGNEEVFPKAEIEGNAILSKALSQTKSIELSHDNKSFSIEFTSLNFKNSSKEVFDCQLEGYDDDWIKTTSNKVSYNKIAPGRYKLKVKLASSINAPITLLKINILAPWYATVWAKVIFIVFIIIVLMLVFREILYRDRLKNEIKLERLNRKQQAELNKEKLAFFTSVSHELKTPLTLISGPLKKLQEAELSNEDKKVYLSIVNRNVQNLSRLINQILDFRKSEKGKLKVNNTLCDFKKLIEDCCDSFKLIAHQRKIKFHVEITEHFLHCYVDIEKAEQIIMNILSNAFKYTPDGGSVLFTVKLNEEQSAIKIKIKDTGIGIDALSITKIFKPFNNVGARPFHGNSSGIGLSLTKNLLDILGGSLELDSKPDQGTLVAIELPFVKGEEVDSENKRIGFNVKKESKEQNKGDYKPTILIVEDNADVQTYISKELESQFTLLQEYDGKKGLTSAVEHIPDLIVSDVMMPIMEGVDMCKHLKLNQNTSHIPVILLTAKDSDENQIQGYQHGAEAYITKPFSIDVLKAQIKSILENRRILQKQLASIKSVNVLQKDLPDLDHVFIEKIIGFVTKEIKNPEFNPEKLAAYMGISQSQLYRKLKAVSGSTVHEFMTRVKMDHAEKLLIEGNLNISQIAYETGFSEPSNFSRTFSKYYGVSPSKYLKMRG
ncbi:helix-turn-helix domain-containing protein [Wenyingzhuangia sp. chi5]|uniref:histidine kinase n=1 Tax=Wenyingzhuangia gilva TaxID=3057677 RepID=A0ABT8VUG7_9FLAO|nr:hybrid sensor histidine kinase/response regulator transcription factor [Wenyingzhuangia sp. chi5]MDO3695607.1 helix-turn-helix domain-containing protein [Wenyingzhuangia sp. chi5]